MRHLALPLTMLIFAVSALALTGCRDKRPETVQARAVEESQRMPMPPPGTPVPQSVVALHDRGLSIYNSAQQGQWSSASACVPALRQAVRELPVEREYVAASVPELNRTINNLNAAISVQDPMATMMYANNITMISARLSVPYSPVLPVELKMMEYYSRELEVWSGVGNMTRLQSISRDMRQSWDSVKPMIQINTSLETPTRMDALIGRLSSAQNVQQYRQLVKPIQSELAAIRTELAKPA